MKNNNIVVITTSCNLNHLKPPIPLSKLEYVIEEDHGFSADEEQLVIKWADDVSINSIPFPLDAERVSIIKRGGRTSRREDTLIAKWVIEIWSAVERWRGYA